MTPEEGHAIRSQLKWKHDGSVWLPLRGRRRVGRGWSAMLTEKWWSRRHRIIDRHCAAVGILDHLCCLFRAHKFLTRR